MSNNITDISMKNVTGNCDTNCSYTFKYSEISSPLDRSGGSINIMNMKRENIEPPVVFNNKNYAPHVISIFGPSLFTMNGSNPPGELRIHHVQLDANGKGVLGPLYPGFVVIIPFKSSNEDTPASQIITDIINKSSGPMSMVSIDLQNIIPKSSFFYFQIPQGPIGPTIIFSESGAIPLSSTTIETLQKRTRPNEMSYGMPPIKELFYNQKGTGSGLLSGFSGLSSGFTSFTGASSIPGFSSSPQLITQSPTQSLANPQSSTSNITDISMKNVTGNCDTNCSYTFNYSEISAPLEIRRTFTIVDMKTRVMKENIEPSVVFNEKKYVVDVISISAPSLFMMNGSYPLGEIRIVHAQLDDNGKMVRGPNYPPLTVVIPLKYSDQTSTASQIISDIINIPEPQSPMVMVSINLQNVIPRNSFFYFPSQIGPFIVFGDSGAIPLSSATIQTLQKRTRPPDEMSYGMPPIKELFYNATGTNTGWLSSNMTSGWNSFMSQSGGQSSSQSSFLTGGLSFMPSSTSTTSTVNQTTNQPAVSKTISQQSTDTSSSKSWKSSQEKLDISIKNITGNCDLKCSYEFKYSESNSIAKNNEIMLTLTYDSTNTPPVTFNGEKYNVGNIMITSPSTHIFNGSVLPGEIIISHNPVKGGKTLNVCIPFKSSSESSSASKIITDVINKVAAKAPSSNDSTNLNMNFNLQSIVPKKPFFSYTEETSDTIVFGELEAIPLSSATITKLRQIIKPYPVNIPSVELFYNSKGPLGGLQLGDGIYISCKPTGSSKEKIAVEYDKTSSAMDFSDILQNSILQLIFFVLIGCIIFIIIFYLISIFFSYLSSEPIKLPFSSN